MNIDLATVEGVRQLLAFLRRAHVGGEDGRSELARVIRTQEPTSVEHAEALERALAIVEGARAA